MKKLTKISLLLLLLLGFSVNVKSQDYHEPIDEIANRLNESDSRRVRDINELSRRVEKVGNYIDNLNELAENKQIPLPVGIKNETSHYSLVVSQIAHRKDSTKIYISVSVPIDSTRYLAFDGESAFSGGCGPSSPGKLSLVNPFPMTFGNNFAIDFLKGTYVEFDCDGISRFFVKAKLKFTSSNMIFYDNRDSILAKPPEFDIELFCEDIQDFTFALTNQINFGFKGLDNFIFRLKNITVDNSESYTLSSTSFPTNYIADGNEKNLWKGLSIELAEVQLPKALQSSKDTNAHTTISCKNIIIDKNGLSVNATASNVCASKKADTTKWDITVDQFSLEILKNSVNELKFDGELNVPPFGEFSLMPYKAEFNRADEKFDFICNVSGEKEFPALRSKLTLNESSSIEIEFTKSGIFPTVTANGKISIDAQIGGPNSSLQIPNVAFEGLRLSSKKPYFQPGRWNFEDVQMPRVSGFGLTIDNFNVNDNGLQFDAGVNVNDNIRGSGTIHLISDMQRFRFDGVQISRLDIAYNSSTFSVEGSAEFLKHDSIYGNGFRGDVKLTLMNKFNVEAVALFGNVSKQKYFFVDVFAEKSSGLFTIPPCIKVTGLGGGVYKSMNQTTQNLSFGKALSGICYRPDFNVGFGFMATSKFIVGQESLCNAKTTFEIQFNRNWGLNYFQLDGEVAFMSIPGNFGSLIQNLNEQMQTIEQQGGLTNTEQKNEVDNRVPALGSNTPLSAKILMKYDNTNKIFNANLKAYLDAGVIYGVGENKKLVDASAKFGDNDWYVHFGRPDDRCGVEVLDLFKLTGYFMVGNEIPALPLPPDKVLSGLSAEKKQQFSNRHDNQLIGTGKGLAFGLSFETSCSVEPKPFFADFDFGAGAEFLLMDYGKNAHCDGRSGPIGFNGWFAEAQLWAYLDAAVGIRVKLFKKQRTFKILDMGAAACLLGKGPNPFYFTGFVNGRYSVLGGLFKGKFTVDFELGEQCKVISAHDLLAEDIITQITPDDSEKDVNVFASPQVILSVAANQEFTIYDEDTKRDNTYRVRLEKFEVTKVSDGSVVNGNMVFDDENLVATFDPKEPFESRTDYKVTTKAVFEIKNGNVWNAVRDDDGSDYSEEKTVTFTSGDRPDHILPQHIVATYPVDKQYNYYQNECKDGYILLNENYAYLFRDVIAGYQQKVGIKKLDGEYQYTGFSYKDCNYNNCDATFEIDFSTKGINFENGKIYLLQLLNIPTETTQINANVSTNYKVEGGDTTRNVVAEGTLNQLETKEICKLNFRTSKYNSLGEKLKDVKMSGTAVVHGEDAVLKNVTINLNSDDFFDGYECQTVDNTNSLVVMNADLASTNWYKNSIYQKMYAKYNTSSFDKNRIFSVPPTNAMTIFNSDFCNHKNLLDNEIKSNVTTGLQQAGNVGYYLVFYCHEDVKYLRNTCYNKSINGIQLNDLELNLLNYSLPKLYEKGNYPYTISYCLPGKGIITSSFNENFVINQL